MKILVWCSWVCPSGGMERVASTLASGLAARGHRVLLVGPFSNAPLLRSQIHTSVECIDFKPSTSGFGIWETVRFLKRLICSYSVDLISAHGSVLPLLLVRDVPICWTEHAIRYPNGKMLSGPRSLLWLRVRSRLRARKWQAIAVSHFVLDSIRSQLRLGPEIGKVIYNALPQASQLAALRPPSMQRPYNVGYLGRLEHEKRPMDVFALKEHLDRLGVDCRWHIFGTGSLASDIAATVQKVTDGRIQYHGYVNNTADALKALDLLVLPSHVEGLPSVVLEARITRRIVVGWRTAGVPEAAGSEGYLVDPPFELSRFADGIAAALKGGVPPPPDQEQFSVDVMMAHYESAFASLLTAAGVRPTSRTA